MLTSEEKAIIIAHGVTIRMEFAERFEDGTKVFRTAINGRSIYGDGEHLTDWKEATRLAWNNFWVMADWAVEQWMEDAPRDPIVVAIRKHRHEAQLAAGHPSPQEEAQK